MPIPSRRRAPSALFLAAVAAVSASGLLACSSTPGAPPSSPDPTATTPPSASPGAPSGATTSPMTSEHRVTAADIQSLLSGQDGADLETVRKDGQPAAMRVLGVRPGSVAARLGARNGDRIESINDVPAGAPNAMGQWTQLATSDRRLTIRGSRQGQPFTTVLVIDGR